MSDLPPELLRPAPPPTWRDRVAGAAESLDLSPIRLVTGLIVIAVVMFGAWRLLEAPPPPVEMQLPMATTAPSGAPADATVDGSSTPSTPPTPDDGAGQPGSSGVAGAEVVVHVAGAVAVPGVQRLPTGARVVDAIDAAGGAAADADVGRVNLAAPLEDGQQVYVPKVGETFTGVAGGPNNVGTEDGDGAAPSVIDLNAATADELDELPGVGPAIAQAIIDHRSTHGPFGTVEELLEVRGIGQAKLEEIRPRVTL